jgi:hypothetical protein
LDLAELLYCQGKDARQRFAIRRSSLVTDTQVMTGGKVLGKRLRRYLVAIGVGVLALAGAPAAGFGQGGDYQNLEPGERADLDEKAPVNFVLVGYDQDDVSAGRFRSKLPDVYKPIILSRYFYNKSVKKALLVLNYTYDYNIRFADGAYESRFFSYLSNAAKPAPLTDLQKL